VVQINIVHFFLTRELVPEAIALTDVLAPPDFIIQSILGQSRYSIHT